MVRFLTLNAIFQKFILFLIKLDRWRTNWWMIPFRLCRLLYIQNLICFQSVHLICFQIVQNSFRVEHLRDPSLSFIARGVVLFASTSSSMIMCSCCCFYFLLLLISLLLLLMFILNMFTHHAQPTRETIWQFTATNL